jgi:hypothetical protein
MRLARAVLAAVLLVAAVPAMAADRPCFTTKAIADDVFGKVRDAKEHTLRGAAAKAFTVKLNAVPEPTDYAPADEVMIFVAPSRQPWALLFLIEHGCATHRVTVLLSTLDVLLRQLGQGS